MATPQDAIDAIWIKYRNSLTSLSVSLDENEMLKKELDLNFTMPADIVELEQRIEAKLANNG
jgi:hypothetical protein